MIMNIYASLIFRKPVLLEPGRLMKHHGAGIYDPLPAEWSGDLRIVSLINSEKVPVFLFLKTALAIRLPDKFSHINIYRKVQQALI